MCERIRRRSCAEGRSRKPTVSRTPAGPQKFWVRTARLVGDGVNSRGRLATLGALAGLISMAFSADSRSLSAGTFLMAQLMNFTAVPYIAWPDSFTLLVSGCRGMSNGLLQLM